MRTTYSPSVKMWSVCASYPVRDLRGGDCKAPDRPVLMATHRRVKPGCHAAFEQTLRAFVGRAVAFPGHLEVHVLCRTHGEINDCAIANRFENARSRTAFTSSPQYRLWLQQLTNLTDAAVEHRGTGESTVKTARPGPESRWSVRIQGLAGALIFFILFAAALSLPPATFLFFASRQPVVPPSVAAGLPSAVLGFARPAAFPERPQP